MIDKAIARITDEMMRESDPLITMLEEHLTNICTNEAVAKKLLQGDKTLKACSKKIWDKASQIRQGNRAHISDEDCCRMAEDYFGITEEDKEERRQLPKSGVIDITQFL